MLKGDILIIITGIVQLTHGLLDFYHFFNVLRYLDSDPEGNLIGMNPKRIRHTV